MQFLRNLSIESLQRKISRNRFPIFSYEIILISVGVVVLFQLKALSLFYRDYVEDNAYRVVPFIFLNNNCWLRIHCLIKCRVAAALDRSIKGLNLGNKASFFCLLLGLRLREHRIFMLGWCITDRLPQ